MLAGLRLLSNRIGHFCSSERESFNDCDGDLALHEKRDDATLENMGNQMWHCNSDV